jgi:hypothetical protein
MDLADADWAAENMATAASKPHTTTREKQRFMTHLV